MIHESNMNNERDNDRFSFFLKQTSKLNIVLLYQKKKKKNFYSQCKSTIKLKTIAKANENRKKHENEMNDFFFLLNITIYLEMVCKQSLRKLHIIHLISLENINVKMK